MDNGNNNKTANAKYQLEKPATQQAFITISDNTPPEISSADTATGVYSNLTYQKRSATKYNDLVVWYPFDEVDGSIALDYSVNEHNATLKNMSASNRVAGKMGGALSFDAPSTKLSSDPSGQHLDLGSWSSGVPLPYPLGSNRMNGEATERF